MSLILLAFVIFLQLQLSFGFFQAICHLEPVGESEVFGQILFEQASVDSNVTVTMNVDGITVLTDGQLGVHVHEFGDITNKVDASAAGGHYIGSGSQVHGCPNTNNRHAGDLGNWNVQEGTISQAQSFNLLTLSGDYSAVGRSLILHSQLDECTGNNLGSRIGQCVIGIDDVQYNLASTTFPQLQIAIAFLSGTTSNCPSCEATVWFVHVPNLEFIQVVVAVRGLIINSTHPLTFDDFGDYEPQITFSETFPKEEYSWYEYSLSIALNQQIGKTVTLSGIGCSSTGRPDQILSISGVIGIDGMTFPEVPIDENGEPLKGWTDSMCSDKDGDKYTTLTDCDDNNAKVNPGMNETCFNHLDDNCDGEVDDGCPTPIYGTPLSSGQSATGSLLSQQWDTYYLEDTFQNMAAEVKVIDGHVCLYINQGSPPGTFEESYTSSSCAHAGSTIKLVGAHQPFTYSLGPFWFLGVKSESDNSQYSVSFKVYTGDVSAASSLSSLTLFSLFFLFTFVLYCL